MRNDFVQSFFLARYSLSATPNDEVYKRTKKSNQALARLQRLHIQNFVYLGIGVFPSLDARNKSTTENFFLASGNE